MAEPSAINNNFNVSEGLGDDANSQGRNHAGGHVTKLCVGMAACMSGIKPFQTRGVHDRWKQNTSGTNNIRQPTFLGYTHNRGKRRHDRGGDRRRV